MKLVLKILIFSLALPLVTILAQTIEGFGGAFTDASAITFTKLFPKEDTLPYLIQ